MNSRQKRGYRGLFIVNFLVCLGFGIVDPFFPVYAAMHGATGFHLAILFSGYAVTKACFSPLMGWWSDRRGYRGLLVAGLTAYALIALGYLFFPVPPCLILLRFLQGVAAALVRPVCLAYIGDMAPARREGSVMGHFDISFYGAFSVGPVLGGIIKDSVGFPGLFGGLFGLVLLALAAVLLFVEDSGKGAGKRTGMAVAVPFRKSRTLVALCGFIFARSFGIVFFAMFLPIFMHQELKLKGIEIGMVMGAATVVTALLLGPMGCLADRVRKERLVIAGGTGAALLTACLPLAGSFEPLLALSVGIGMASVISLPASAALLVEEGNRLGMGTTMGIFNGAMGLGAVLAPLLGGAALGLAGMKGLFFGAGCLGLGGTLFYAVHSVRQPLLRRGIFDGTPVSLNGGPLVVAEPSLGRKG
jgi:MFS family permease